jgi:DNA-binding MarR family transcriptional regulator
MAQKGLVERREHRNDRRRTVIEITHAGQAIINDNAAKAAEIATQIRDKLGPRRFETLLDILDDLRDLE